MSPAARGRTRRRTILIAFAIFALLLGAGAALYKNHKTEQLFKACSSVRDYAADTGGSVHIPGSGPTVAIVGDSFSTGDHLEDRSHAWVNVFAKDTQKDLTVFAEGGTGFLNEGFCGTGAFGERLKPAIDAKPSSIIIEGGLNDVRYSAQDVRAAAAELIGRVDESTSVIVIGPVDAPALSGELDVDRALMDATKAENVTYVSALDWDLSFGPDGVHLTDFGHETYAADVAKALDR